MKAVFFLFLLLVGTHPSHAQGFIGKTPSKVKRDLDRHIAKTNVSARFDRTDTTLTVHIRDPKYQPVDFSFRFANGRCVEEVKVGCDSCVRKYLKEALQVKAYGWSRVNESTYVSKRFWRRMMVVKEEPSSLLVRKMDWTRKEYEEVRGGR